MPLPVAEVSGLGHRQVKGAIEQLAAGDDSTTLITFRVDGVGKPLDIQTHDLAKLFGRGKGSQWEAVAGDGDGRVFLLEETRDVIHVVASDLESIVQTIRLVVPKDHPLAGAWAADANSRGEGMILLSNGHVLVAKEKNPPALVEFAPAGQAAAGYVPELALGERVFPLPAKGELVATKHWGVKTKDAGVLRDLSDLALDDQNRFLLLTDEGRAIARIERQLDTIEERIDIKATFPLPAAIDKPEGLIFVAGAPFVASDAADAKKTALHRISPLP